MASACSIVLARDPTSMMGGIYPSTDGRLGSRASSCILMSVAVICVCVMVVCGVFVLREYTLAKNYEETSCRLTNITYSGDIGCMHCSGVKETNKGSEGGSGGSCAHTHFPCLHVLVSYRYNSSAHKTAILYENSVQAVGAYSQCSYSVCMKTREENQRVVDGFADRWRAKSSRFLCYYDSDDQDKVIAHKTYSRWDVIHSMLWPSLVLLLCGGLFLHLETRRRGLTFCGIKDEKANKNQQDLALRDGTNTVSSGQEKWSASPSRDRLLQGSQAGDATGLDRRKHPGKERLSKLSSSMSSLEKVSTRTSKPSPPLNRVIGVGGGGEGGGGGGGGIGGGCNERLLKRKTASVDRLADVRVKPDNGKRFPVKLS